ncbi:SpoIIE family protein phosphatase [Telmatobacter sp. DSM 110680]|uniref:SpoIIE family protein phosphatase n=1 Tax=Telmatobacter sp. DSM 110680 TaxID=3036704 RepID=A0AAU7DJ17_9BACT
MHEQQGYETILEVAQPNRSPESVVVSRNPFLIGRGSDTGNHLLLDDPRISRRCAVIEEVDGGFLLRDRGHRPGIWVNGRRIAQMVLMDGDTIEFGLENSAKIVFRWRPAEQYVENMLTRLGSLPAIETTAATGGLSKLNLLLEATSLLHSALPLESVLGTMLDHAMSVTNAERGLLLEADDDGVLTVRLARGTGGKALPAESIAPSQTALRQAVSKRSAAITDDLNLDDLNLKSAQSVVVQGLRAVVAIPLYAVSHANADGSEATAGRLLGALYLDSRRTTAFSNVDRQILDALSAQAASILDNARLVEKEREQRRMEQELAIAREIQQGLVPQGLREFPHLEIKGVHLACHGVGGDYYDVFPLSDGSTAFLVADVTGKGLGAALLTTMLQGALSGMRLGVDPAKVFNHVNRFLCEHASVGRCATMFFGRIDAEGRLEYLNGGHPSPLLIRNGMITELYTEGTLPIGLSEEAIFEATRVQLEPDDVLVLFSDGIVEAANTQNELFGFERLNHVTAQCARVSIETVMKTILDAVEEFSRGAGQADDLTLLIVRYRRIVN